MNYPVLVRHARYRWDELRRQHQLVFPEGILVLNDSAAAVVELCDGRPLEHILQAVAGRFGEGPRQEACEFLQRLARKGLLRDAERS